MVAGWWWGVIINRFFRIYYSTGVGLSSDCCSDSCGVSFRVADLARSVIPVNSPRGAPKKVGREMEELFAPPVVPVVTAMTIFNVHDFYYTNKKKTVRNYMNGRVLRLVAK